jgi:hypothetical protein
MPLVSFVIVKIGYKLSPTLLAQCHDVFCVLFSWSVNWEDVHYAADIDRTDFITVWNSILSTYWSRSHRTNQLGVIRAAKDDEIARLNRELDKVNQNIVNTARIKSNIGTLIGLIKDAINRTNAMLRAWLDLE